MNKLFLFIYTRRGCCICESLESKLRRIALEDLVHSSELIFLDIDTSEVNDQDRIRYDLEVPVICIGYSKDKMIPLPRVSPRLNDKGLINWLNKVITQSMEAL
tara:strand:+ start:172 stop:480 length:309 start_codon:yes stop_codon:yes gene_type:complete